MNEQEIIEKVLKEEEIGKICGKIQTRIINSENDKFKPITEIERKRINRECFKEGYKKTLTLQKQEYKKEIEKLKGWCEEWKKSSDDFFTINKGLKIRLEEQEQNFQLKFKELEEKLKEIMYGKIDWIKVFKDAYEQRKTSWYELGHIKEWRNATDEILFAVWHQFEKEISKTFKEVLGEKQTLEEQEEENQEINKKVLGEGK